MKHGADRNGQQEVCECVSVYVHTYVYWGSGLGERGAISKISHPNIPQPAAVGISIDLRTGCAELIDLPEGSCGIQE